MDKFLFWELSCAALILIVAALRFLLRKRLSPTLRYALWLVVLVRLLVPGTVAESPVSVAGVAEAVYEQAYERYEEAGEPEAPVFPEVVLLPAPIEAAVTEPAASGPGPDMEAALTYLWLCGAHKDSGGHGNNRHRPAPDKIYQHLHPRARQLQHLRGRHRVRLACATDVAAHPSSP